jgi:hypothetical protein
MSIYSNSVETASSSDLRAVLAEKSVEVFAIDLNEEATADLIEILTDLDESPRVRLLARRSVLKWVRDDFVLASAAAEVGTAGRLSFRTTDEPIENALLVTEETVVSLVPAGEHTAGLVTDAAAFVEAARTHWASVWESAEEFDLRTPARSRVEDSLAEEFGPEVESDFQAMLGALETLRTDETDLDEVAVSLLAAAKHEELLYDVSKWGADVGMASKPTFSRTKNQLEERGLIATEKVPIDVGRPRQRLLLGDERLRGAAAAELASAAQSLLSPAPV